MISSTPMRKSFALWPVKLFSGKWTWLTRIYYVFSTAEEFGGPGFLEWTDYFTEAEAIVLVLNGEYTVEKAPLPFERLILQGFALPVVNVVMTGFAIFTLIYQFY